MNILDILTNGQASQLGTNGDGAERLVANLMLQRAELMKSLLDTPRDVDSDCQYPTGWIPPELYQLLYMREPIATRVVEVFPKECFQVSPSVYEDEDAGTVTPFEEAWDALGKQLRGEQSFYQEEESSVVWDFLLDADIKSGIGHYAAILLGLDDGAPLDQPVDMIDATKPVKGSAGGSSAASRRLLFMQVYPETAVRINALETDTQNPRYGQPTEYDISMLDPLEFSSLGLGASLPTNRAVVHWSRVVHVSESGVLHTPRQRPVLNRLLDTRKLYSSSAEMYWRGAFPGYAIKTQPQLGADVDLNRKELETEITNYSNSLQRFLILMGMDVTALAPQISDPSSQIDKQIEAICIQLGIPKRIFMGSERGELASSQDDAAWNDRLKQRQLGVITPRIIIPVVDRLISLRVLPRPAKGYRVSWPDLTSKSDEEKAGIATQRTQAIAAYTAGQLETTLAPMDFWTRIMGFTEDESQSIIDNAEEIKQQKEKEQTAKDAEAARVQAEAQARIDAAAKTTADATGSEQPNTAPGSPTSPGKPFGGKGSQSPTSAPPNASVGQPGGSNTVGNGDVGNSFCPTGPGGGVDPKCSPKSTSHKKGDKATPQEEVKKLLRTARRLQGEAATKAEWGHRWYREVLPLLDSGKHQELIGAVKSLLVKIRTEQYPGMAEEARRVASLGHTLGVSHDAYFNLSAAAGALKEASAKAAKAERHLITAYRRKARLRRDARSGRGETQNQTPQDGASVKPGGLTASDPPEVSNVFCPTGEGGGVDPSCSPKSAAGSAGEHGSGEHATGSPVDTKTFGRFLNVKEDGGGEDKYLTALANENGYGARPKVVPKDEMDKLVADGHTEMFRGSPPQYDSQMRSGEYYAAKGRFGAGYYLAGGPEGKTHAATYAANGGVVSRMALDKSAKIADYNDLVTRMKADEKSHEPLAPGPRAIVKNMRDAVAANDSAKVSSLMTDYLRAADHQVRETELLYGDVSRYAMHHGYDAIRAPTSGYHAVLNRSKLYIQEEHV